MHSYIGCMGMYLQECVADAGFGCMHSYIGCMGMYLLECVADAGLAACIAI